MRIGVVGATGRTGRLVVQQALERGHSVVALTRSSGRDQRPRLAWLEGSIDDLETLRSLTAGVDLVISTVGPRPDRPSDTCSTATANLIAAGVMRLILVSGMAVSLPEDRKAVVDRIASLAVRLLTPAVFADKVRELDILRASAIDWTAARVGILSGDSAVRPVKADIMRPPGNAITAGSLAAFCLDEAEQHAYPRLAPFVAN